LASRGNFFLKQYVHGKPTKWIIKAWGVADSANGYLMKCDIVKEKNKFDNKPFCPGEQVVLQLTENFRGK
jgi:hypothetical protein